MTQKEQILQYLRNHKSITPWDAFDKLGITKLATRIGELLNDGHNIDKKMREKDGKRVMSYSLATDKAKKFKTTSNDRFPWLTWF